MLSPLADINKNVNPNSNGLDASGEFSRSSGEDCTCVICGNYKYISPQKKNLGKQRPKSSNTGFEPPAAGSNVTRETRILETLEEINAHEGLPKVMLCDVVKKCEARCYKCGYVLPDALKSKVVRCFKQDMKAELQIWSRCSGHSKLKNHKRRSNVLNNKSISQSLTGHQKHLEDADFEASQSSPAELLHGGWIEEDSEARSAAVRDHQSEVTDSRTNLFVEEDTLHRCKRIKLGDSVGSTSTVGSALKENCSVTKSCDHEEELVETEPSSEAFSENHDPESFTCQRVKPYVRNSCSRTDMPWPFLQRQPACSAQGPTSASATGSVCSPAAENSVMNQNQVSTKQRKDTLQDPSLEEQKDCGESFDNLSSYSCKASMDVSVQPEASPPSPQLDSVLFPISGLPKNDPGVDPVPSSLFPVNSTEIDTSTPSPSALGLSDWETTEALSPLSDPSTQGPSSMSGTPRSLPPSLGPLENVKELQTEDKLLLCKDTKLTASVSLSPVSLSNSSHSCISPSLLHQYEPRKYACCTERSPPKLKPFNASPIKHTVLCDLNKTHCMEMDLCEFRLAPVLSPITSPQFCSWRSSLSSSTSEEEEVFDTDANRAAPSPEPHSAQIVNRNENTKYYSEKMEVISSSFRALTDGTKGRPQSSSNDDKDASEQNEEDVLEYSDHEDTIKESSKSSEQGSPEPKMKTNHGPGVQTEPCSSLSCDEEDQESFRDEADGDCQLNVLDEFTAYERDVLLVEVTQDDPELFQNLPKQSLVNLGPVRRAVEPIKHTPKKVTFSPRIDGSSSELEQK